MENLESIKTEKYHREYSVDQGNGFRTVQYKAWRIERPTIFGYGMTEEEATQDLIINVQPL